MRGINCNGLRNQELIDALCWYDNDNYRDDDDDNDGRLDVDVESQGSYNEGSDLESDGDGNVYLHRDDKCDLGDTGHISRPPSVVSGTRCRSEREMELELQIKKIDVEAIDAQRTLERERWERERERQEWRQPEAPNVHPNGNNVNGSDVNISLPRMIPGDDDVLTFFNTFERTLELHCIDRTWWSRQLVPQLTAKAQKSYVAFWLISARIMMLLNGAFYHISD